jgi:hypothetical protein
MLNMELLVEQRLGGNKYAPIFKLKVKCLCFVEGQVGGFG